jgi:hypothetical protein
MKATQDMFEYKVDTSLISRDTLKQVQSSNELAYVQQVLNANVTPIILNDYIKWFVDNGFYAAEEDFMLRASPESIQNNTMGKNLIKKTLTDLEKAELWTKRGEFIQYLNSHNKSKEIIQSNETQLKYMKSLESEVS